MQKILGKPIARCAYYEMPVIEIERPDFPFVCENMDMYGECPAYCRYYQVIYGEARRCEC